MGDCVYKQDRKGDRDCPALGGKICSRCCGRHRLVDIDCPRDCRWLQRAIKNHRERFFQSNDAEDLDFMEWFSDVVLNPAGTGLPGGDAGVNFLLRTLDVIHWKLKQRKSPDTHLDVLRDALRYLKQVRTGKVMSVERAPSSLARTLESFFSQSLDQGEASSRVQQRFEEAVIDHVERSVEWCETREKSYFDFLDRFFTRYNLPGWQPVKEEEGRLLVPGVSEESTEGGDGDQEEGLILPG